MRNRKFIHAALALLTLGFAACQQEEDFVPQEQEINLNITAGSVQTRVNTLGTGNVWENGDELYFCRVSKDNQWAEYSLTATVADEVTTWTPDNKLFWDDNGEHKLVVNYPSGTGWVWDRWYILADQSTLLNLKKADHMNAMWKGTPTTEPINLTLKHRLSMVTVTYTLAEEFESTVEITPEVYSYTQYLLFDIHTLERKDVTWEEGHEIWVKAYKHEEVDADGNVVAKKFTAIVSPDAYAAGDEFIRVTIGDQVLTAKMQEDITFAEGTHYTFDLKVGKDVLTIEQVSMNDSDSPFGDGWNNEEDLN
ncbi:MAG: fimbrillin family protein [Bacteroides xylanisolvens]